MMSVMEKPPPTPYLQEVFSILDELQRQIERLVQQVERAKKKCDTERLSVLEPQKVELQARFTIIKETLDDLDLGSTS